MSLRWYVVHAYSNYENQVKKTLEERVKRSGLEQYFGSVLVPTEEVVEMRSGQQRKSEIYGQCSACAQYRGTVYAFRYAHYYPYAGK